MTRVARVNQRPFPIGAVAGFSGGSNNQVLASGSNGETEWTSFVRTISANGSNYLLLPDVNFASGSNILFTFDAPPLGGGSIPSNTLRIHSTGGSGTTLTVEEEDGSPSGTVSTLIFPNNSVTISGSEATIREVPQAFIGCRVSGTSTAITSGAYATLAFGSADSYDTDGFHDPVTNNTRITVPAGLGGKYLLEAHCVYPQTTNANTETRLAWRVNGGADQNPLYRQFGANGGAGVNEFANGSVVLDLAAGDYVEVRAWVTNATSPQTVTSYQAEFVKLDSGKVGGGIGARATNTAATAITTATPTAMPFATEDFDTDGFHNTVTNNSRLTIPTGLGGKYLVVGQLTWGANFTANNIYALIRKNGSTDYAFDRYGNNTAQPQGHNISAIIDLVPTDYVELIVNQDSGSNKSLEATAGYNSLSIMRLDSGSSTAFSGVLAFHSTTQSITSGAVSGMVFDSESYDTDDYHSTVTNTGRLTVPAGKGGKFIIGTSVEWASNSTGERYNTIRINGSTEIAESRISANASAETAQSITATVALADGDYVECVVFQNSGGNLNAGASARGRRFWMQREPGS